jgi:glycosyltransferase involved in cell wall biosynthesis
MGILPDVGSVLSLESLLKMDRKPRRKSLRKVLIVTYYYLPMESVGSYRNMAFAKYLPHYGFKPLIMTPIVNRKTWFGPVDLETPIGEQVFRVPGAQVGAIAKWAFGKRLSGFGVSRSDFRLNRSSVLKRLLGFFYDEMLTFPDPQWPWYVMGRHRALHIARNLEPDIILSSALPFSSHLMAAYIQRELRVPWVADYRDLWSKNHNLKRTKFIQRVESYLEKRVLQSCSAATTVSGPLAQDMRGLVDIPVHVVTNGFDPDEYKTLDEPAPDSWKTNKLNIIYTGLLYPGRQNPTPLFEAIQILWKSGEIKQGDIKVWFYGPNVEIIKEMVSPLGVGPFVELPGLVPRRQALICQRHADLLLLLVWTDPAVKGVFTRKFFEYLGTGKPILAVGPSGGVIDQALKETGMGVVENDPHRLARIIQDFIQKRSMKKNEGPHSAKPEVLKKFTSEYQTGILARILENAIGSTAHRVRVVR